MHVTCLNSRTCDLVKPAAAAESQAWKHWRKKQSVRQQSVTYAGKLDWIINAHYWKHNILIRLWDVCSLVWERWFQHRWHGFVEMYFSCAFRLTRQAVLTACSWIHFGPGCSGRSSKEASKIRADDCKSFIWSGGSLNPLDLNTLRDVAVTWLGWSSCP